MSRLILVDADGLLYLAAAAGEETYYEIVYQIGDKMDVASFRYVKEIEAFLEETGAELVDRETKSTLQPLSHCLRVAKMKMETIANRYYHRGASMETYVKGDGTNYRNEVSTLVEYKANRPKVKPHYLEEVRQYMMEKWNAIPIDGKEADDQCATRAFEASKPVVICSPDKDLDQIPGLHWNYSKNVEYEIDQYEADFFFWTQVLAGDSADFIKGCWQIGDGGARSIVTQAYQEPWLEAEFDERMWELVVSHYAKSQELKNCPYAGLDPEAVAIENARLVWMQTENLRLWTPPGKPFEYLQGGLDD